MLVFKKLSSSQLSNVELDCAAGVPSFCLRGWYHLVISIAEMDLSLIDQLMSDMGFRLFFLGQRGHLSIQTPEPALQIIMA